MLPFDQIYAALVSIRGFFQKHPKLLYGSVQRGSDSMSALLSPLKQYHNNQDYGKNM